MDLTVDIVLTVIGLVIGFLVSAMIHNMRSGSNSGSTDELNAESDANSAAGTAEAAPAERRPTDPPPAPELVEAARIWRDRLNGQLVIEVDNKLYKIVGELNPILRDRLGIVSGELRAWLENDAERTYPAPKPAQPPPSATLREQPEPVTGLRVEPARPSINPLRLFARAIQEMDKPKLDLSPASIAAQIDEILQRKMEDTLLEGRSIRLMELPGQGMVVMVGLDKYDDVDAIPDEKVRRLIREAVAEWEETSIPDRER